MRPCLTRRSVLASLAAAPAWFSGCGSKDPGWTALFDGNSLAGWQAGENSATFGVEDGCIVANGPRAHLFYAGPVRGADFKNFELQTEVLTHPGANSGLYFHTAFQETGWPAQGFEVQINNTHVGEGNYRERKKTGSLYGVRNVYKAFARDDEWFQLSVEVRGKNVQVRLNGTLLVDYLEPDPPFRVKPGEGPAIGHGTFALQGHDPHSVVRFRNIRVKPLPDDLPAYPAEPPTADNVDREIFRLGNANYPMVDYHSHLKGDLTIDGLLAHGRRTGIQYGVAVNCGVGFGVTDDSSAEQFLRDMQGQPVHVAMQAEGREWVGLFSPETIAKFDYVFTDSMTFSDDRGRRMRLWIPAEVGGISNPEAFMDLLVNRAAGILTREPIDIYVNPTFLPDVIASQYNRLWTPKRMARLVEAARKNDVAIEINNRYRLPSPAFIRIAKEAGLKFSFGTNNSDANLGRLEYCLEMVNECGLKWQDIFVPRPSGEKPIQLRGLPKVMT
jgi:hypothetical protein